MANVQRITPNLWFNHNAKEAIDYYMSVFPDSSIEHVEYYPETGLPDWQKEFAGKVLTISFELFGQHFLALNAGPEFSFTEAVSFIISCKDQAEIDYYWEKLSAHPENEQCGWCKDQFGLSWQVVPEDMDQLMQSPGAFGRMMDMKKLVIADLAGKA